MKAAASSEETRDIEANAHEASKVNRCNRFVER
jgi:hypothetical protein